MKTHYLTMPLKENDIMELDVGDVVYLSGKIITARDKAHLELNRLCNEDICIEENFEGSVIFHAGPIVKVENNTYNLISIGPTTSMRMEPYANMVGSMGVKALVGKGGMGEKSTEAMQKYKMVYLLAPHACAAVHTTKLTKVVKQYWMDSFGMPEALWVMNCKQFGPLIVGIDSKGNNLFEETKENARKIVDKLYFNTSEVN